MTLTLCCCLPTCKMVCGFALSVQPHLSLPTHCSWLFSHPEQLSGPCSLTPFISCTPAPHVFVCLAYTSDFPIIPLSQTLRSFSSAPVRLLTHPHWTDDLIILLSFFKSISPLHSQLLNKRAFSFLPFLMFIPQASTAPDTQVHITWALHSSCPNKWLSIFSLTSQMKKRRFLKWKDLFRSARRDVLW